MSDRTLTVSQISQYLKQLVEGDSVLRSAQVSGEVSNLKYHSSGHVYFSLKERDATLNCVMWRSVAQRSERLGEGDQVIATGGISLYPPRGQYQLVVRKIEKAGLGNLYQQFLVLKEKLRGEGLFDSERKQKPPRLPRHIAIVTSPTAAALRDVLQTLRRRYPAVRVTLVPAVVQGERGATSIVAALGQAERLQPDLILLVRGGGSIEDLWNFNEEKVARSIAACVVPIVTGVGHESDETIADYVADRRASTPTAAAESVVPNQQAIQEWLVDSETRITRNLTDLIRFRQQVLDDYQNRLGESLRRQLQQRSHQLSLLDQQLRQSLRQNLQNARQQLALLDPQLNHSLRQNLQTARQQLDTLRPSLKDALQQQFRQRQQTVALLAAQLEGLDLGRQLERGFSLTLKEGKPIRSTADAVEGDTLETLLHDGKLRSRVLTDEAQKSPNSSE